MSRKTDYYTYCRTHRKDARIDMAKKYRDIAEREQHRDIETLFKSGNNAQREKLLKYSYKDDWNKMSFDEISSLIYEESEEVHEEIIKRKPDYMLLRHECADLMNSLNFMICLCDKHL